MSEYVNDDKPFYRKAADKIEGFRRRFIDMQKTQRTGTLAGLEDMIAKRKKQGAQDAK